MFWKKIINIGIHSGLDSTTKKKIQVLNGINSIRFLSVFLYNFTDFFWIESPIYSNLIWHWVSGFSIIGVFLLFAFRHYFWGYFLFLTNIFINIFAFSFFLEPQKNLEFYFLIIPIFSILLIPKNWFNHSILILCMLCFFIPNWCLKNFNTIQSPVAKVFLFLGFYVLFFYLKKLNEQNEQILETQKNEAIESKLIIEQQKKELEELHHFQNQFFQNVAHEIKTPLTIIKGNIKNIIKNDANILTQEILTQSSKIEQIVEDVLDLAKMNNENFELKKDWVNISMLVAKTFHSFSSLFDTKKITYSLHIENEQLISWASSIYLERCLNNLLINAFRFTPENGTIECFVHQKNKNELLISIQDTGIGIKEEEKEKIFERFFQSKNSYTQAEGTGIGLAFCKEIITLHDGKISANNRKDQQGSIFTFSLPLPPEQKEISLPSINFIQTKNDNQYTILLVEDNLSLIPFMQRILSHHSITIAHNGKEALKSLENQSVDLIITDYMMPEMNGVELIQEIKKRNWNFPIIMLTAKNDLEEKIKILEMGVQDYICKPFDEQELLVRIQNVLQQHQEKISFQKEEHFYTPIQQEDDFVINLKKFIEENCTNSIFGINEICEEFALSNSSLYRKVKLHIGLSPKDFIIEVRLLKAYQFYQENPTQSIKELAQKVGYVNYTHFHQLFEKRIGISLKT